MNKKIIIAFIILIIAAVIGIAAFVFVSFPQPSGNPVDNVNVSDVNENIIQEHVSSVTENDFSIDNISSSQDTSNIVTDTDTEETTEPNPDGESFRGDWSWNGERIPNSDTDYSNVPRRESGSAGTDFNEEQMLNAINKQEYNNNAVAFLNAFLTYSPSSLANGQYVASWQGYVSSDALVQNTGSGLLYQHALPAWNSSMSSYGDVTSSVRDIVPESIYVSPSGTDANKIVVRCSCVTVRNDALPGEIVNWKNVHTYSESWALAFDGFGKIINATRQSASALDNDPDWVGSGRLDY